MPSNVSEVKEPVQSDQRYSEEYPCPICEGWEDLTRGEGRRCHGYIARNKRVAFCSREEYSASLPLHEATQLYAHGLRGPCRCGESHEVIEATYNYVDEDGELLYQVVRYRDKSFRQRRPKGHAGWQYSLNGVRRVLYRLPELLDGAPRRWRFLSEGEKDVERLRDEGLIATTNSEGAKSWRDEYAEPFRDQKVVVLADNDADGERLAKKKLVSLIPVAKAVKYISPRDFGFTHTQEDKGKDVFDWFSAGHTKQELLRLAKAAPTLTLADVENLEWPWTAKAEAMTPRLWWEDLQNAATYLATAEPEPTWLVPQLLSPKSITIFSSPSGVGKSQVAFAISVAVDSGNDFCSTPVKQGRVLYLNRDNSTPYFRQLLEHWGAKRVVVASHGQSPTLTDAAAWEGMPVSDYALIIVDSLTTFTEDVDENSNSDMGRVMRLLRDIAEHGPAILLLHNTSKDGSRSRGATVIKDRSDYFFEVRDATGHKPSKTASSWWKGLPAADEGAWSDRAERHTQREVFRVALIQSKQRSAPIEPRCFEIRIPQDRESKASISDVTHTLTHIMNDHQAQAQQEKAEKFAKATEALKQRIREYRDKGDVLHKLMGEGFLYREAKLLTQAEARKLVSSQDGIAWHLRKLSGGQGKGNPIGLFPADEEVN